MMRYIGTGILLCVVCNAFPQTPFDKTSGDSLAGIDERTHFLDEVVVTGTMTSRTLKNTPVLTRVISGTDIR
ncbi:MAG: TonB-dependent receptor, partial [Tannerella sp.]|nr:TonB-dependent receptor [Tannerella sp.]